MASGALACVVACSLLPDDGRIVLPRNGALEVTPSCIGLNVPTDGGGGTSATASATVVITAQTTGRYAAESLPVTISVGPCEPEQPPPEAPSASMTAVAGTGGTPAAAGASVATNEAGMPAAPQASNSAGRGGAGGSGGAAQGNAGSYSERQCIADRNRMAPERWSLITLTPSLGDTSCTSEGPERLSCALDANGAASFSVVRGPTLPDDEQHYVPLCVRAPRVGGDAASELIVVFSPDVPLEARSMLANRQAELGRVSEGSCATFRANGCDRGSSYVLELLSTPPPAGDAGAAGSTDDAVATREILTAQVSVPGGYVALGGQCSADSAHAGNALVSFPSLSSVSNLFAICSAGSRTTLRPTAVLVEDQRVMGVFGDGVEIPSALERVFFATDQAGEQTIQVKMCGEEARDATPSLVTIADPRVGLTPSGVYYLKPTPSPAGMGGSAGVGGAGGGGGTSTAGTESGAGAVSGSTAEAGASGADAAGGQSAGGRSETSGSAGVGGNPGSGGASAAGGSPQSNAGGSGATRAAPIVVVLNGVSDRSAQPQQCNLEVTP